MKKDMRKAMAPKPAKSSLKIKAKSPMMNTMSLGAANAPMDPAAGLRSGMKKGGACKGYYKGGSVDGAIKQGRTRGKVC